MSQFRIQRKLTEGSNIKLRPNLSNPHRIRSLESKHSPTRSPKKLGSGELRRMVRKVSLRGGPAERGDGRERVEEGMRAFREKEVGRALELFREAQRAGERSAEVAYYIGSCLLNLGKHQASIVALNECLQLNERFNQNAYLYVAINFKLLGNPRQAVRTLDRATALFPAFEEGFFYRGKLSMKLAEWPEAVEALTKCTQINPANDLATIFLGDCHRAQGRREKACEKYTQVVVRGKRHRELAVGRVAAELLEQKREADLYRLLKELLASGFEHPEASYYMGLCCWALARRNDAVVYLQSCLSSSREAAAAGKALKALIRMACEEGNFFEAEHHITRIQKLELNAEAFEEWRLFVQGANDLIKRKNQPALDKIRRALAVSEQKEGRDRTASEAVSFRRNALPYAAYALYLNAQFSEAITTYDLALQLAEEDRQKLQYAKVIVEGVSLHQQQRHEQAAGKFSAAHEIQGTVESLFLSCICLVQRYKCVREGQTGMLGRAEELLRRGRGLQPRFALFLFYSALLLMFEGKPCLSIIQQAIAACEEPISEYHFIEALALQQEGKLSQALDAISRAIELDPGIEEFYRQRSKYHFMGEDWEAAIEDCRKAEEMAPDDDELPLLLAFYYYLSDQVVKSYNCLLRASPASGKLKEFEQALHLRLGMYDRLGEIGQLLTAIGEQRVSERLIVPVETLVAQRYQFSEFSVYFYHLLLAVGYAAVGQTQRSLDHLFGCLEEIQLLVDEREGRHAYEVTWEETEEMLDEVKFNIVIVSLLKEDYEQTRHFIEVFLGETESDDLKETLERIKGLVEEEGVEGEVRLTAEDDCPRISDRFPLMRIALKRQTLITKLLMSFPVKLKFTIAPEFDPAYLLNFDIDKVEYRVPPPWLKAAANKATFTASVRNQSVLLSDSQASDRRPAPSPRSPPLRPSRASARSMREKLKLDRDLQQKLKRIIQK